MYNRSMGGLSKKSLNLQLRIKRQRSAKLRQLKRLYKKATSAERAALAQKAQKIAPYMRAETYLKES